VRDKQEKSHETQIVSSMIWEVFCQYTWNYATPHQDRPLPDSTAQRIMGTDWIACIPSERLKELPFVPGQEMYGLMIPRTKQERERNRAMSKQQKQQVKASLLRSARSRHRTSFWNRFAPSNTLDEHLHDVGVEVLHADYDNAKAALPVSPSRRSFFS
jgi:hypothetical protein